MTTAIEQAIKEAVKKGGWKSYTKGYNISVNPLYISFNSPKNDECLTELTVYEAFLDLTFWQALGKARGWSKYLPYGGFDSFEEDRQIEGWKAQWHLFIDHVASGGDAESFFASLV